MNEFLAKLALSAVLACVLELVDAAVDAYSCPGWLSVLIALVVVFGGWLIIVEGDWS